VDEGFLRVVFTSKKENPTAVFYPSRNDKSYFTFFFNPMPRGIDSNKCEMKLILREMEPISQE
jgi:hypothetical protein